MATENNSLVRTHIFHGGDLPLISKNLRLIGGLLISGFSQAENLLFGVTV